MSDEKTIQQLQLAFEAMEQPLSFEEAMNQLEQIVRLLEVGDVPLETAILEYQKAMELSKVCRLKLDEAQQKIEMLVAEDDWNTKKPFQPEE